MTVFKVQLNTARDECIYFFLPEWCIHARSAIFHYYNLLEDELLKTDFRQIGYAGRRPQ